MYWWSFIDSCDDNAAAADVAGDDDSKDFCDNI